MESEDALSTFRHEWKIELENSYQRQSVSVQTQPDEKKVSLNERNLEALGSDIETQAEELFMKGVHLEQDGQVYESIYYYRKAIYLVPDIERRIHYQSKQGGREDVQDEYSSSDDESLSDISWCSNLTSRFERMGFDNHSICLSNFPQDAPHISCLPMEMLDRILHWVVGSEMDFESLDKVSRVCKGFFVLCRKPDLWRRGCLRIWGIKVGELSPPYTTWREMFIWRPRPRFNGCYISKVTYFRSGEESFQDLSIQPWHIVCYYRYLRFFPGGKVLMHTTSDEPQNVVSYLKSPDVIHSQVLIGHYRLHDTGLTLLFQKKPKEKKNIHGNRYRRKIEHHGSTDVASTTYNMELEIKAVRNRPHWQMIWRCYSVVSSYKSGPHTTSVLNVSDPHNFPPMIFSRVKGYTLQSDAPFN